MEPVHAADQIPYIERLADFWGELCGSAAVASEWADRLIDLTRMALSPDKSLRGYFHGTSACLSALFAAERYGPATPSRRTARERTSRGSRPW